MTRGREEEGDRDHLLVELARCRAEILRLREQAKRRRKLMTKRFYVDLAERVAWTAVQGFAAEWVVTASVDAQTFKIAGVAAGVAVAKCLLASRIGDDKSAAALPGSVGDH